MANARLIEVFRNGNPDVPVLLVVHRDGAAEYDHCALTPDGVIDAALALLRSLPPEQWADAVKRAVLEHDDFVGERFIATLKRAPQPAD